MKEYLLLVLALSVVNAVAQIVNITHYGAAHGNEVQLDDGTFVRSWYGIPYAKPPVGRRRFERPEPAEPWTGVFDARQLPNVCIQDSDIQSCSRFSEDCLNLNIFTPKNISRAPLAVLVWFYGGRYMTGANILFPGHFLAAKDVIVVVPNYRIGIFGFLATPNDTIKGNMGMFDQILALQWVRDNIDSFGGDPQRVTIAGQSAGAASVSLHLLSPWSRGLFQQAIMESGTDSNIWSINYPEVNPRASVYQSAESLNCTTQTESEMVACLKNKTACQLMEAQKISCVSRFFASCSAYAPIVDGPNGFLPKLPKDLESELRPNDTVPIINGINRDDGSYFTQDLIPEAAYGGFSAANFTIYLKRILGNISNGLTSDQSTAIFQILRWYYTDWSNVNDYEANRQAINQLLTDYAFGFAWDGLLKAKSSKNSNTYGYIFAHRPVNAPPSWMGVTHADELPFVWGLPKLITNSAVSFDSGFVTNLAHWTNDDISFADCMMTLWTNFIKYGNPTPQPVTTAYGNCLADWPKFSVASHEKLIVFDDTSISTVSDYNQRNYALYRSLLTDIINASISNSTTSTPASTQTSNNNHSICTTPVATSGSVRVLSSLVLFYAIFFVLNSYFSGFRQSTIEYGSER